MAVAWLIAVTSSTSLLRPVILTAPLCELDNKSFASVRGAGNILEQIKHHKLLNEDCDNRSEFVTSKTCSQGSVSCDFIQDYRIAYAVYGLNCLHLSKIAVVDSKPTKRIDICLFILFLCHPVCTQQPCDGLIRFPRTIAVYKIKTFKKKLPRPTMRCREIIIMATTSTTSTLVSLR